MCVFEFIFDSQMMDIYVHALRLCCMYGFFLGKLSLVVFNFYFPGGSRNLMLCLKKGMHCYLKKGEDYVEDLAFVDSYCRGWIAIVYEIRIWIIMELLLHRI